MEKGSSGKRNDHTRRLSKEVLGVEAIQTSEAEASHLIGRIVEKGISSESTNQKPLNPASLPSMGPTALPFPVARHRSHGPHWAPLATKETGDVGEDHDDAEEDNDLTGFDPIAAFANPIQRKPKKGLDLRKWRELLPRDNSNTSNRREVNSLLSKEEKKGEKASLEPKNFDLTVSEMNVEPNLNLCQSFIKIDDASRTGDDYAKSITNMDIDNLEHLAMSTENLETSTSHREYDVRSNNFGSKQEFSSIESEIDAENLARLEGMSPDEIGEAQAEIMEKMSPSLLEALKKRGREKLGKKQKTFSSNLGNSVELENAKYDSSRAADGSLLSKSRAPYCLGTKGESKDDWTRLDNGPVLNVGPIAGSLWNAWSRRVEAIGELRFSLDGTVIDSDSDVATSAGTSLLQSKHGAENVTERDFLRTEGDPAAAGYTIKEAAALTRSVVPGQRALALHLLASVLDKAINNIYQKQAGYTSENPHDVDWEGVWAFALGPEPELVLALRISLDDNHNSVVLACAKVIQCILSCDLNEKFFDVLEKIAYHEKDISTAPVFRSKPVIDYGFLRGGFWKYNTKPSNVLPFAEDITDNENTEEGDHTIQDDIVVAGQDFAAGLVRMGILPRILYLLETNPSVALEECLLSILIAIARHSVTSANAIMKCQRLVQTIVNRFSFKGKAEIRPSMIKSVTLLKILARSDKNNCLEFIRDDIFPNITWHLYRFPATLDEWLKSVIERRKIESALIVEQLRFWKVCVQYGHCVSYFEDFFTALCLWLNPPAFERLSTNNAFSEFTSISTELYLVLAALARKLPTFASGVCDDTVSWCWTRVAPMVNLALKWIESKNNLDISKSLKSESVLQDSSLNAPLLWVISAIMHMLSTVLERCPNDIEDVLPDFVPTIGLAIVRNGSLTSFIEEIYQLRQHQREFEMCLSSVCCLQGLTRVMNLIDKHENLEDEIGKRKAVLKSVYTNFYNLVRSEWQYMQFVEFFGRGGPAPGVGVGWGASGGGFWSKPILLAQTDARLLIQLLEIFQDLPPEDLSAVDMINFAVQKVNSILAICLTSGPNDRVTMEKALDILLQVSSMKDLDLFIRHFLHSNGKIQPFGWEYKEEDYILFSETLSSHFKTRWLSAKKKKNKGKPFKKVRDPLETIHEEPDTLDYMNGQEYQSTCLITEWAHQRLPLPTHWFLSPISTLCNGKNSGSNSLNSLEVWRSGLFFLLGVEAMSSFLNSIDLQFSPVKRVPLIWKVHSLSVFLLVGMSVIEEEKSRDVYRALQELYGQIFDESSSKSSRLLNETDIKYGMEILRFQTVIHESYSTFIETLVEQFAAVSYGDLIYGRQVAFYLHRRVEAPVRLSAWNALSDAHVLELLPPLDKCVAEADGYLEPVEDDEEILEAYMKSWVTGALDRAATRGAVTFTLALHHLSSFIFQAQSKDKLSLRNRLIKSLLRGHSRKQHHKGVMLKFILYSKASASHKPEQNGGLSLQKAEIDKRFELLREACEGNSSLLTEVEKLRSSSVKEGNIGI